MSTESERLITALIDHAQAMQQRSEAQQDLLDRVLEALPSRVGEATCEGLTACGPSGESALTRQGDLHRAGGALGDACGGDSFSPFGIRSCWEVLMVLRRVVAGSPGAPVRLSSCKTDEAALWSGNPTGTEERADRQVREGQDGAAVCAYRCLNPAVWGG